MSDSAIFNNNMDITIRLVRRFSRVKSDVIIAITKCRRSYIVKLTDKDLDYRYKFRLLDFNTVMCYIDTILWQFVYDSTEPYIALQYDVPGFPTVMVNRLEIATPIVYNMFVNALILFNTSIQVAN